jgi:lysophospholipase-3
MDMGRRLSLARVSAVAATTMVVILSLSSSLCVSAATRAGAGTTGAVAAEQQRHPVVLIPGAGGNQLEARLTEDYKPSSLVCRVWPLVRGRGGWFRLWFDPSVLVKPLTRCFAERMTLSYDADADDYRNAPGVETRVTDFGSTSTLRYLDPSLK